MIFNIEGIISRLKLATDSENDLQLCNYLGRNPSTVHGWRKGKKPPLDVCLNVALEKKCDFMWLVFGEKIEGKIPDEETQRRNRHAQIKQAFLSVLTQGYEFGYISLTVNSTEENLELMANSLYEKLTGDKFEEVQKTSEKEEKVG